MIFMHLNIDIIDSSCINFCIGSIPNLKLGREWRIDVNACRYASTGDRGWSKTIDVSILTICDVVEGIVRVVEINTNRIQICLGSCRFFN